MAVVSSAGRCSRSRRCRRASGFMERMRRRFAATALCRAQVRKCKDAKIAHSARIWKPDETSILPFAVLSAPKNNRREMPPGGQTHTVFGLFLPAAEKQRAVRAAAAKGDGK